MDQKANRDKKGRFVKGNKCATGRPQKELCYTDALRGYYALTPAELYAEASKKLSERNDITVAQACALLDAAQALVQKQIGQRQMNANRLDGYPTNKVTIEDKTDPIAEALNNIVQAVREKK